MDARTSESKKAQALPECTVMEVRVGKVRRLGQTDIMTGIDKLVRAGPVRISTLGVEGDEQGEKVIHGGPDKAVLQYAVDHYPGWRKEFPGSAHLLKAGGFGENIVASGFDEENICVGDVVEVGSVRLQVAQPRQPCFKLNHRFQQASMSRRAQESHRTGWYYRVLQEGTVSAEDVMRIIERPYPQWSVSRVQHYLYDNTGDRVATAELANLEVLAAAQRQLFAKRLSSQAVERWDDRLADAGTEAIQSLDCAPHSDGDWTAVRVKIVTLESKRAISLVLVPTTASPLPPSKPGSHIRVKLPIGLERCYSLCNVSDGSNYKIAVNLAESGNGGSNWLHKMLRVGDTLLISRPVDAFSVVDSAKSHILIAGGIGITPFVAMIDHFRRSGARFKLYYCARSPADAPFHDVLKQLEADEVSFHFSRGSVAKRLDLSQIFTQLDASAHVYCCGPRSLMASVRAAAKDMSEQNIHFEAFTAGDRQGEPFEIRLASTNQVFTVGPQQTILEVLRQNGVQVESSCEAGSCGTCVLSYRDGEVRHADFCLSDRERKDRLAICVSRATTAGITLEI